jgi:DcuC family C4-dicarboxylate transporter
VVVPVMRAAGFHPLVIGSALLLGSSVGGELFNPGAPELNTVFKKTGVSTVTLARVHLPWVVLPQLVVSTLVFWALTRWWWKDTAPADAGIADDPEPLRWWQAAVPLVPLFLLVAAGDPLNWIQIPEHWLVEAKPNLTPDDMKKLASGRTVGLAMIAGSVVAALAAPRKAGGCVKAFFEGGGYALTHIVSLIVVAVTFGKALEKAGFDGFVGQVVASAPWLLVPLAVLVPWAFAAASGSGMASTSSLYGAFHPAAEAAGADPNDVGALVSIGSAAGRTMSPVAAVAVMCGRLTDTTPWALAGRVAVPLLAGLAAVIALRMCGVV